jgi:hypothetical protein
MLLFMDQPNNPFLFDAPGFTLVDQRLYHFIVDVFSLGFASFACEVLGDLVDGGGVFTQQPAKDVISFTHLERYTPIYGV